MHKNAAQLSGKVLANTKILKTKLKSLVPLSLSHFPSCYLSVLLISFSPHPYLPLSPLFPEVEAAYELVNSTIKIVTDSS